MSARQTIRYARTRAYMDPDHTDNTPGVWAGFSVPELTQFRSGYTLPNVATHGACVAPDSEAYGRRLEARAIKSAGESRRMWELYRMAPRILANPDRVTL